MTRLKPKPSRDLATDMVIETIDVIHDAGDIEAERTTAATDRVEKLLKEDRAGCIRWYRSNIEKLAEHLGWDESSCKSCKRRIWWTKNKNGKAVPISLDGLNHFADCPSANQHRSKR